MDKSEARGSKDEKLLRNTFVNASSHVIEIVSPEHETPWAFSYLAVKVTAFIFSNLSRWITG